MQRRYAGCGEEVIFLSCPLYPSIFLQPPPVSYAKVQTVSPISILPLSSQFSYRGGWKWTVTTTSLCDCITPPWVQREHVLCCYINVCFRFDSSIMPKTDSAIQVTVKFQSSKLRSPGSLIIRIALRNNNIYCTKYLS